MGELKMNKKFLSMALCGAILVGGTVGASATTIDRTESMDNTIDQNVKITGTANNSEGIAPAGTLSVTVPTQAAFTVDSTGKLTGSTLTVANNSGGGLEIETTLASFTAEEANTMELIGFDSEGQDTIELENRGQVKLTFNGTRFINGTENVLLSSSIASGSSASYQLSGTAGPKVEWEYEEDGETPEEGTPLVETDGVSGNYNLVLRVAKAK